MSQDPALLKVQYRDGTNLNARIALHARFSTAGRDFHDWLFDHITLPADAYLLELGCGTGQMWTSVASRVPNSWHITLTDLSSGMLTATRATFGMPRAAGHSANSSLESAAALANATYAQADAQALPFPADFFDAVIANHMLYHVPDIPRALSEVRRVLKPAGRLFAATNGENHLAELAQLTVKSGVDAGVVWAMRQATTFRLENGAELLAPHFESISRDDFHDNLAVTEVDPLVAYVLSMNANMGLIDSARAAALRATITRRLTLDGVIHISKSAGLFVAQ